MPVTVIVPPDPIVLPNEIAGVDVDDAATAAMIAAVTAEIDGPEGWVRRCFGPQTLELRLECWPRSPFRLPCPPVIQILGVGYLDSDGNEQLVDQASYGLSGGMLYFKSGWVIPSLGQDPFPVKIAYEAGYDGEDVSDGGTGPVPEQARQAIILSVRHLRSISRDDLFMRADEVEGVGRTEWTVSEQAGNIIRTTAERLLQGLRVY